jgi:hypothetical protein
MRYFFKKNHPVLKMTIKRLNRGNLFLKYEINKKKTLAFLKRLFYGNENNFLIYYRIVI